MQKRTPQTHQTQRRKTYAGETIKLDNQMFENCVFENCTLVFAGGPLPSLKGCSFIKPVFAFEGPAGRTVQLLKAFARPNSGFQSILRSTFPELYRANYGLDP